AAARTLLRALRKRLLAHRAGEHDLILLNHPILFSFSQDLTKKQGILSLILQLMAYEADRISFTFKLTVRPGGPILKFARKPSFAAGLGPASVNAGYPG